MKTKLLALALFSVCSFASAVEGFFEGHFYTIIVTPKQGDQWNVPVTVGQPFHVGDMPPWYTLTMVLDGVIIPTQLDVKALHPDSSMRHGIISAVFPRLTVGTHKINMRRTYKMGPNGVQYNQGLIITPIK